MSGLISLLADSSSYSSYPVVFGVPITGVVVYGIWRAVSTIGPPAAKAIEAAFTAPRADRVQTIYQPTRETESILGALRQEPVAPRPTQRPYAFISYHHRDRAYVSRLVAKLHSMGIDTWHDQKLEAGSNWREEVGNKVANAAAVVVVMTGNKPSTEVGVEIGWAQHNQKPLFPISVDEGLYFALNVLQRANVTSSTLPDASFLNTLRQRVASG